MSSSKKIRHCFSSSHQAKTTLPVFVFFLSLLRSKRSFELVAQKVGRSDKCWRSAMFQMTNEIIHLCTQSISLDRIFTGYVFSSKQVLQDCMELCLSWKEIYLDVSQLHLKYDKPHLHRSTQLDSSDANVFQILQFSSVQFS